MCLDPTSQLLLVKITALHLVYDSAGKGSTVSLSSARFFGRSFAATWPPAYHLPAVMLSAS